MAQALADKLTRSFFKRSLWITLILCSILSVSIPVVIYRYHLQQYNLESAEIINNFIDHDLCFRPADLLDNPRSRNAIVRDITAFMEFGRLVEFKIWAKDGTLVHAIRGKDLIGMQFDTNEELTSTLTTGKTMVQIEKPDKEENEDLATFGPLVEMYAPIIVDGVIEGAVEVYRLAPRFEFLKIHIALVVSIALTIFAVLHLLMAGRFKKAASELLRYDEKLHNAYRNLGISYINTIRSLSKALELRDMETEGHSERVVALAILIAEELGVEREGLDRLILGSYLHDIGKIGVPDQILLKPGALDAEERQLIETHVSKGMEIIRNIDFLKPAAEVVLYHHERWDGCGYPGRLKGEDIPLTARIFAVVDVFDALTSSRPYKEAQSLDKALATIFKESGKHFDPVVVEVFMAISAKRLDDIRREIGKRGIHHAVNNAVQNLLTQDQFKSPSA